MIPNFFKNVNLEVTTNRKRTLPSCGQCGLFQKAAHPKMEYQGEGQRRILIIGTHPSKSQDKSGNLFHGKGSRLIKRSLRAHDIDLERDCWRMNAISCVMGDTDADKKAEDKRIIACMPRVWKFIRDLKPAGILILGRAPMRAFLLERMKRDLPSINEMHGQVLPDRETKCWVGFSHEPKFVFAHKNERVATLKFNKALSDFCQKMKIPFPRFRNEDSFIRIVHQKDEILHYLAKIKTGMLTAHDYESTGLKPFREGHAIKSIAITVNKNLSVGWKWTTDTDILDELRRIFTARGIYKIAANLKMERMWSKYFLGVETQSWAWDTMLASHVFDNRKNTKSLKFHAYLHYGIIDYDSHISKYLKALDDEKTAYGANAINRIDMIPMEDLLKYNCYDSLLEHRIAIEQMERMFGGPEGVLQHLRDIRKESWLR